MEPMIDTDWWSAATIAGLELEFETGLWASDDLLEAAMELKADFYWQSHTLAHLARDDLSESDCNTEDGGKCLPSVRSRRSFPSRRSGFVRNVAGGP